MHTNETRSEAVHLPSGGVHSDVLHAMPTQSSANFPVNPTTGNRYGIDIGTGTYDTSSHSASRPVYTIHGADFKRTAPSSGQGIHAQQYRGRESGPVSAGNTTYIREATGSNQRVNPNVNARVAELDINPNSWEGRFLQEKQDRAREAEGEMESEHRRERKLRQEYEETLIAGQVKPTK